MIFKNYFCMVKSICVQPPLLARLATASILLQRAVNRQPGYRSGNSKGRSPISLSFFIFCGFFKNFKKYLHFSTFLECPGWIELWNFKVNFTLQYHFYKLQYVLYNNPWIHKHHSSSNHLWKQLFQVWRTVVQPSFLSRLATVSVLEAGGKPSTWFPLG